MSSRFFLIILLLAGVLCLVSIGCVGTGGGNSGSNTADQFPAPTANFAQYTQATLTFLQGNSLPQRTASEIRTNLPFELPANPSMTYRGKFLLLHGLSDSAYVWRDIAAQLSSRGFDVRAVLLPGHGSHPEALLNISYQQWLEASREHFNLWNTDETPIYLGGFSVGGVLATVLALENPEIAGLLLISPAYHSRLNSLLRWSSIYSIFRPWLFGGMILEDNPMKYNSIPINSGAQYYNTTRYLKRRWGSARLAMPVMMVGTLEDSVVDIAYLRKLFRNRVASSRSRLLLYTGESTTVAGSREIIRSSRYSEKRLLNQSHLSLMNSPRNPLYGEKGTQLICNGNEYPVFMACMRAKGHWYGAQHTPSPDGVVVARTTYNPDFAHLLELFDKVFALKPDGVSIGKHR